MCARTHLIAAALLVVLAARPSRVLAQSAPAAPPAAPVDRAGRLFDAGVADLKLEKYEAACAALEESYGLEANLGTLIALGDCLERWGKLRSAAGRFEELIAAVTSASAAAGAYRAPQLEYARAALARITPQIPRLSLGFAAPIEAEVRVLLDERELAGVPEQAIAVDPGRHSIETRAPDREPWRVELELSAGEQRRVELELGRALEPEPVPEPIALAPAPTAPPASPDPVRAPAPFADASEPPASNPWRTVGWGLGGLGVAGIGVGAVAGIMVLETCPGLDCKGDRGKHLALVTDVGFGVGLAALAASVYVLLETEPPAKSPDSAYWSPLGSLNARGGWLGVGHSF